MRFIVADPFAAIAPRFCCQNETIERTPPVMAMLEPTVTPHRDRPRFGFNETAEKLNGRLAMLGFITLIAFEITTHEGFLHWLGLV